ncbi:MAG: excinuclease ABC subunit UvrC [Bacteroidales bacterium]|nr:excinuclease ABC subunit UvrC [Bacteroidales bacterium]
MIDAGINPNIDRIALRLKTIPESPGVYQHLDADGKVIYVGKARNLQRRVSSYFTHYEDKSPKIKMLVRSVCDIRVTVVATEIDALLLENSLIKRYQPRYNSMLKDDKTYPYLCITDEPYPRLLYTRRKTLKGQYFGPYPNGRILRELQDIIRQLFQYRTCDRTVGSGQWVVGSTRGQTLPTTNYPLPTVRPCMKHQIGLCGAPCAGLQSQADYQATIENIRRILKGDFGDLLDDLKRQMYAAAADLRFEEAEVLKRKLHLLEEYQSRSTVVDTKVADVDVISILGDDQSATGTTAYAWVNYMRCKHGAIIYSISNEVKKQLDESDAELLATIIPTLHEQSHSTAREIILPFAVPDLPDGYLQQNTNPRGDRRKLLELSLRNVESFRKQCLHQKALLSGEHASESGERLLARLQKALALPSLPMEIECFDNSNIQGAYPVAGMVRFSGGKPNRKEYRKFNIKTVEGPDDYASMAEVIGRRYSKLEQLPDLLLVDGGEGQMEMARRVLRDELHCPLPIAGLAKNDNHRTDRLLAYDADYHIRTVQIKPTDPLFHLLERIQDEVHRFAITFHKDKRSKGTFRTSLTDIDGIGEKTAHDLLLRFGSVKQVQLQTLADLTDAIGPAKARLVYDALHGEHD